MCLIVFAWQCHDHFPLIFAGNRDEFFVRPTAPAQWWSPSRTVLAGRDLQGGGTWCGVSRHGRLAALTNIRAPQERNPLAPSRGAIVADFLNAQTDAPGYLSSLAPHSAHYNGYNLVLGEHLGNPQRRAIWFGSNRASALSGPLGPGLYGISNAALDTPWPKVQQAKARLALAIATPNLARAALEQALLDLLADTAQAPTERLPDTGVPLEIERQLSPAFIRMTGYGTRASTVIVLDRGGALSFLERSFDEPGQASDRQFELALTALPA